MSEAPQSISLFELNIQVKSGIHDLFPGSYWIMGEISEMNVNQSGHCYIELIEKKADSEQIIARAKGTIWAFTFRMLRPYFESVTGQHFSTGIKVMIQVSIEFHEVYGYSLNIKDIEPESIIAFLSKDNEAIIGELDDATRSTLADQLFTGGELLKMGQLKPAKESSHAPGEDKLFELIEEK